MKYQCKNVNLGILGALTVTSLLISCGAKKDKDEASTESAPTSVADLKLSSALQIEIPDALKKASGGSGASLALSSPLKLAGKRSSEACRTMQQVRQVMDNIKSIGSTFCHLEVESDKMQFGKKYTVNISGQTALQDESLNIWVDNADPKNMKVYMCKNGKLSESFNISGFGGSGKAKGSVVMTHEHESGKFGVSLDFDFTQAGYKIVDAKMKGEEKGAFTGSFASSAQINLADSGVSKVAMSSAGSFQGGTHSDQGVMLFNGKLGQALFVGSGSQPEFGSYSYSSRSTFDDTGYTVASSSATADIIAAKTSLPEKLSDSFAPSEPSGWDCSGATETISLDMTDPAKADAHNRCDTNKNEEWEQCHGDDFEFGENVD